MPEMPEWAHVWFWLRFLRDPTVPTPLPQQGINSEAMSMSMASYELYAAQWRDAGSPRTSERKLVAAMTGAPVDDDEEIPF
jgi:hypothetical protein